MSGFAGGWLTIVIAAVALTALATYLVRRYLIPESSRRMADSEQQLKQSLQEEGRSRRSRPSRTSPAGRRGRPR